MKMFKTIKTSLSYHKSFFQSDRVRKNMNSTSSNTHKIIKSIFLKCINAVQPQYLFKSSNCFDFTITPNGEEILNISDKVNKLQIDISGKNCHLIGFGKGVLGMAVAIENILGKEKLKSGVLSIPIGQQEMFKSNPEMKFQLNSNVEIYEGAENNLPDRPAEETAKHIRRKVKNLSENDILFVLITGGGSALIPLPIPPITLEEKTSVIRKLVSKGATIEELNTVRIAISQLKGGKLLELGWNCNRIISLIISDVINDPIEFIASSPTLPNSLNFDYNKSAKIILEKYEIINEVPGSIHKQINKRFQSPKYSNNSSIFLIGNNKIAIESGLEETKKYNLAPIFLSNKIQGDVQSLSEGFTTLAILIKKLQKGSVSVSEFYLQLQSLQEVLCFEEDFGERIQHKIDSDICLISGGEPTVKLNGSGLGGRNQELALRFGLNSSRNEILKDVLFLSGGTDGIDGPTSAAGAIGCPKLFADYGNENEIEQFIFNNDSYNFFKQFYNGSEHIVIGHTGTNVMDIQILIIPHGD